MKLNSDLVSDEQFAEAGTLDLKSIYYSVKFEVSS